jgi:hypothetical protein
LDNYWIGLVTTYSKISASDIFINQGKDTRDFSRGLLTAILLTVTHTQLFAWNIICFLSLFPAATAAGGLRLAISARRIALFDELFTRAGIFLAV